MAIDQLMDPFPFGGEGCNLALKLVVIRLEVLGCIADGDVELFFKLGEGVADRLKVGALCGVLNLNLMELSRCLRSLLLQCG